MFKRSQVGLAVLAMASGAGLVPMHAIAQSSGATATQSVVVTGSRLLRPDLIGNSPVLSVGIETLGSLGIENFADMATQLPQFAPAFGASRTQSTFSGVATSGLNLANLRNLGSARTLVLINGRRAAGGTSTSTSVDFNNIPVANIERIDISTGGAAAVYGSDAVSGVINIITKKNFQGIEIGAGYGQAAKGDNENPTAHIMAGTKFGDAGRILMTLQFDKQGQVSCRDRELCSEDFAWTAPATQIRGPAARSGVGLGGRFFIGANSYTRRNNSFTDASGALIPFSVPLDGYNRNADRDLAIPTKRTLAALDGEYAISSSTKLFGEFNYGKTTISSDFEGHPFQSQAAGSLFGALQATIPINNPFIPAPLLAAVNTFNNTATAANKISALTWWQRLNNAGGPRGATNEREMTRAVFGLKGEFASLGGFGRDWRWEASHVEGRTKATLGTDGLVNTSNLYYGLRVEADPANPGKYRCIDATARAAGCVPINPFADYTDEQRKALSIGASSQGVSKLSNSVVSMTGTLMDLPAGAVRAAAGLERRSFGGYLDYSPIINQGLATGNNINDTDPAKTTTKEVFAEIRVPLFADLPAIQSMNIEGAFRRSDASKFNYNTWNVSGDWEPVSGLRFRAAKARSVRSPLPGELSGGGLTAGVVNDPCTAARRNLNPVRATNCTTDGIPANYAPALVIEQGVSGQTGGNANLTPEIGTTSSFGLVWEPKDIKGLAVTIDRFKIDVSKIITTVSRQIAVDKCYDTAERLLCGAITRGTNPLLPGATYVLTSVNEQLQNVATQNIAGVDLNVRYSFKTAGMGDFNLGFLTTIYDKATLVPLVGSDPINLLGQAGGSTSDQGYIKVTASANVGWKSGKYNATYNLRYIGSADMSPSSTANGFPRVPEATYSSIRLGYDFAKDSEVFFGITNMFNKKPPLFATGTAGTQALDTVPGYYDVFGRSYFVGARMKF
jgi:iron complex outermembrane recepter protein